MDEKGIITITSSSPLEQDETHRNVLYGLALTIFLFGSVIPTPHISTSERLGIALFYKELDATRSVLVEKLQELVNSSGSKKTHGLNQLVEKEAARFSRPIRDNIDFVRGLENIQKHGTTIADPFKKEILSYFNQMLGGKYRVDNESIFFAASKRSDGYSIPLHLGSSSVRSLMDIFFYLKHSVGKNDLLIIDEPEGHLTPQNQIILTRMLATCAHYGINIFITTHSDYIVKELNNLIMLHEVQPQDQEEYLKQRKCPHKSTEIINPADVKGYLCANGTLEACELDKYGLVVKNIDDAIETINSSSSMLFNLLNK